MGVGLRGQLARGGRRSGASEARVWERRENTEKTTRCDGIVTDVRHISVPGTGE